MQAAVGDSGWVVPEMLSALLADGHLYADITGQVEMDSWRKGRVILLGDAAFAVSLLAGQGASMAIGGAYALGQALDTHADLKRHLAFNLSSLPLFARIIAGFVATSPKGIFSPKGG